MTLAASGEEGLAEIAKSIDGRPYDLVIMDWKMPGMDGIKASQRIKHDPRLTRAPVIILVTAYGREEIMQQAEAAGLDGFLIKPVNPSVMFDTIMQAFGKNVPGELRLGVEKDQAALALKSIEGARVLVVEDNEINQQVAMEILVGAGLNVTLANNGQEGVNAVQANLYDAVLMDVQMPVMDGHTATRHIRRYSRFKDLPIIAMTAHAMTGDQEKSIAAGMNDHVTKPIDPAQLLATLARWIPPQEMTHQEEPGPAPAPEKAVSEAQGDGIATFLPEQSFPNTLSGFDLAEGLQRLQGNRGLYRKLLLSFSSGHAQAAEDLRKVLDANDYDQAHSLVHSIKGVAGNLAARELHAAAVGLEKLLKHADEKNPPLPESINEAFAAFEDQLERALQAVRSLPLAEEGPSPASSAGEVASLPPELAKEAAGRLREAADMGDVSGLMAIAEELSSRSDAFAPYKMKITQLADDFDFDGILGLADNLMKGEGS